MHAINAGDKFGKLVVLHQTKSKNGKRHYRCRCICGREVMVDAHNLLSGNSKSCGRRDIPGHGPYRHGDTVKEKTVEYTCWCYIKQKCRPGGAGGMGMAPEWVNNFPMFLAEIGRRPSRGQASWRF
jgi:hypothetical protein